MIEQKYLDTLKALGTDTTPHSGRTLFAHLKGVYDLLAEWGNDQTVCLAGLFHSIYGTRSFQITTVPLNHREMVREVIGAEAEELAYLFCICDRKTFYPDHPTTKPDEIHDVVNDLQVTVSEKQLTQLIEVEAANTIDQMDVFIERLPADEVAEIMARFLRNSDRLTPGALAAVKAGAAAAERANEISVG